MESLVRRRRSAMRCSVLSIVLVLGLAGPAGAAIISMSTDKMEYLIGESLLLTVYADSQGDSAADDLNVILTFDPFFLIPLGAVGAADTFTQLGGSAPATVGANQGLCGWEPGRESQCLAFDQQLPLPGQATDAGMRTATFEFVWQRGGVATFTFQDATGPDFVFFDLGDATDVGTSPAGTSAIIPIPEPTTAALLGLGLIGLAGARRRR